MDDFNTLLASLVSQKLIGVATQYHLIDAHKAALAQVVDAARAEALEDAVKVIEEVLFDDLQAMGIARAAIKGLAKGAGR